LAAALGAAARLDRSLGGSGDQTAVSGHTRRRR
jgi:hypothetical protein